MGRTQRLPGRQRGARRRGEAHLGELSSLHRRLRVRRGGVTALRAARLRPLGVALVLLLVAPLIALPAAGSETASASRAAIQALLDRRAAAWLEGDEDAFMATVSRADPAFFARQRTRFRWGATVPFSGYRLVAKWDAYGDLARPSERARYADAEDVALPLTQERYSLGSYDERDAVDDLFLTFVKEGGRWLVASDSDLSTVGLPSSRHLWDYGPVVEETSAHFSLLRHPCDSRAGCPSLPDGLLPLAERALEQVDGLWSAPWRKKVVMLVPTTADELARMIQATFDLDNFVAFASSTVDLEDGFDYGGHRVLLNPSALAGRTQDSVFTILAHELLHVATRTTSGPFVPTVVEEGIAEYVGHDADPDALAFFDSEVASGNFEGSLPQNWEFLTGSGTDIYTSYQEAYSAVTFFVQRWGLEDFIAFYERLGRPAFAAGTTRHHVDRALRATIGVSARRFESLWADSIESRS